MNTLNTPVVDSDTILDNLAAELTQSAYTLAHAHRTPLRGGQPSWLDLELTLWVTLRKTVQKWDQLLLPTLPERLADWWEDYLAELTDVAYRTMLCFGMRGSFLEVELSLHRMFRAMVGTTVNPVMN